MRILKAVLGALFAIVGFGACLAGLLYMVTTKPEHFREPVAAAAVAADKKED